MMHSYAIRVDGTVIGVLKVLILVLMDDALVHLDRRHSENAMMVS